MPGGLSVREDGAFSFRSFCPFCGSNEDLGGAACCPEWAATGNEATEPRIAGVTARASRSLIVAVASSIVATIVFVGTQSRFARDHTSMAAAPIRASVVSSALAEIAPPLPRPAPEAALEVPIVPPADIVGPQRPESERVRTSQSADDLEKWTRLRRGMSRTAVRIMFGYPQWVDRRSTPRTEYWLYASDRLGDGAWIAFFDQDGPVASWRSPERGAHG